MWPRSNLSNGPNRPVLQQTLGTTKGFSTNQVMFDFHLIAVARPPFKKAARPLLMSLFTLSVFTLGSRNVRAVAVFLIKNRVWVCVGWATTREWQVMNVKEVRSRERVEEFKCNDRVVFRHQTEFIIKRLTWGGRSAESGGLFRFSNFPLPFSVIFFCIPSLLGLLCCMIYLGFFLLAFICSRELQSRVVFIWNICSDGKLKWNDINQLVFASLHIFKSQLNGIATKKNLVTDKREQRVLIPD